MMNIAFCMPDEGYLQGLLEIAHKHGALLIMDEVKTGAKLAWGGACEYFNVNPTSSVSANPSAAAFRWPPLPPAARSWTSSPQQKMFHAGTYNTNPGGHGRRPRHLPPSADPRRLFARRSPEPQAGGRIPGIIGKTGLVAYADGAGANGALLLYPQRIRNYRDWYHVDEDLWTHYWFAMVNRGVLAQPYWWDEQWTNFGAAYR
jgi:glutamate-1-semialdehyde 2,1-aminomutase